MSITDIALTVVPIVWGLFVKYHPRWAKFPNLLIPYVTAAATLVVKLAAPTPAQAGVPYMVVALLPTGLIHFFTPVVQAGWQAIQNALIYEVFLRGPAESALIPTPKGPAA